MTLKEFVDYILSSLSTGECYIAIMPSVETDTFHLEVESEPIDSIAGSYDTETSDLQEARQKADELEDILSDKGIFVYQGRSDWENNS